jgi:hypothetical protein
MSCLLTAAMWPRQIMSTRAQQKNRLVNRDSARGQRPSRLRRQPNGKVCRRQAGDRQRAPRTHGPSSDCARIGLTRAATKAQWPAHAAHDGRPCCARFCLGRQCRRRGRCHFQTGGAAPSLGPATAGDTTRRRATGAPDMPAPPPSSVCAHRRCPYRRQGLRGARADPSGSRDADRGRAGDLAGDLRA